MNITERAEDYTRALLDTPFDAPCVKRKGYSISDPGKYDYGILVSPTIHRDGLHSKDAINHRIAETKPATVIVRGHGWSWEIPFVWTGTAEEFNETWEID